MNQSSTQTCLPSTHSISPGRLRDLNQLLVDLLRLHEELVDVVQRKLLAMRKSDVPAMQECMTAEQELTEKIQGREGLRRQLMVIIGRELGLDENQSRNMPLSRLRKFVDHKKGLQFRVLSERLAAVMGEISKVNSAVMMFAQRMLEHYRHVFGAITRGVLESPVYAKQGRHASGASAQVFDATG